MKKTKLLMTSMLALLLSFSLFCVPALAATTTNLLSDPGFRTIEDAGSPWSIKGSIGTVRISTDTPDDTGISLRVSCPTAVGSSDYMEITQRVYVAQAGTYAFAVDAKASNETMMFSMMVNGTAVDKAGCPTYWYRKDTVRYFNAGWSDVTIRIASLGDPGSVYIANASLTKM